MCPFLALGQLQNATWQTLLSNPRLGIWWEKAAEGYHRFVLARFKIQHKMCFSKYPFPEVSWTERAA